MQFDDGYNHLEKSYPDPFETYQKYNLRAQNQDNSNPTRFKTIDGDVDNIMNSSTRRDQVPTYHSLPDPEPSRYVQPYQHAMKRPSNSDRMKEIFGNNQDYSGMDEVDFKPPQQQYQQPPQQQYQQPPQQQYQQPPQQQYQQPPQQYGNNQQQNQSSSNKTEYVPRMKYIEMDAPPKREVSEAKHNSPPQMNRRKIYNSILEYFPNFIMTKTAMHSNFSVYKSVVQCLLCDGTRYIVAIVKNDLDSIGTRKHLGMLSWENFQTRWADDDKEHKKFNLSTHPYAKPDKTILDDVIRLSRKTTSSNLYECDNLPLNVEIIRSREDEEIAETGTVSGALELFSCLLTFGDDN